MTVIPKDLTLEQETQEFYKALGESISKWQRVEENLATIFAAAINNDGQFSSSANAAFHSVLNFKTKLDMTHAALNTIAFMSAFERLPGEPSPMFVAWGPLRNRASRRADARNEMAHFAMHVDDAKKPGYRCYLAPNFFNVNAIIRYAGKPPTRNTCALIARGNSFDKLGVQLLAFYLTWFARG
jgi:hypothetical protein